ncbi:unnamed protein product [Chrysoparadoxa australica]
MSLVQLAQASWRRAERMRMECLQGKTAGGWVAFCLVIISSCVVVATRWCRSCSQPLQVWLLTTVLIWTVWWLVIQLQESLLKFLGSGGGDYGGKRGLAEHGEGLGTPKEQGKHPAWEEGVPAIDDIGEDSDCGEISLISTRTLRRSLGRGLGQKAPSWMLWAYVSFQVALGGWYVYGTAMVTSAMQKGGCDRLLISWVLMVAGIGLASFLLMTCFCGVLCVTSMEGTKGARFYDRGQHNTRQRLGEEEEGRSTSHL